MPEKIKQDICRIEEAGVASITSLFGHQCKRLASNLVCLVKKIDVAIPEKALELKVDRGLFRRMLILETLALISIFRSA